MGRKRGAKLRAETRPRRNGGTTAGPTAAGGAASERVPRLAHRATAPSARGLGHRARNYSLKRWASLVRYVDDPLVPNDNNHIEGLIRPVAIGRNNWLFAGSLRAGQRSAAIMTLIQSAKLNGHDPYAYLKDVLTRLPTQIMKDIAELLPYRWGQKNDAANTF